MAEQNCDDVNLGSYDEKDKSIESKKMTSEVTYNWKDATSEFFDACNELQLGELLHDEMFGLFEAMSAIEMMDPKMDAGMLCNRGSVKPLNFDQAIAAGKLKLESLTIEEQIGIIDATLACVVTWLEGHSLAQTVLTNLYLHKPCMIKDKGIKAFSICVLKLVELIRDFIDKANVFEEEDFQPVVYGYKLATDVFELKAAGMLKEVEDELQRKIKNTRSKHGEEWDSTTQEQHNNAVALYSRIKFCRLFYQGLLAFGRKEGSRMEDVVKFMDTCGELLPVIKSTIGLGLQPQPRADIRNRADYPIIMGFEPLVNQRLLPPTFPRYIKIKSRLEAITYFEELVFRFGLVYAIHSCQSYHSALDFFITFSKLSPCVLSRSIAQSLYLPQWNRVFGVHPLCDVLRDAARTFICPPALAPRSTLLNNPQAKDYVDTFLSHCVRPFSSLVQICGHNRARQRGKFAQILEDFANLQDEADKVDAYLHNLSQKMDSPRQHLACFGTWILYHTLRIMILYVLSGFELELYSTHEYHYVFWYLFEFLYGWMVSALSRADGFLLEQETSLDQQKGRNSKRGKTKKKKSRPHEQEIIINQASHNLCGGYCKALVGFILDGKMKKPVFQFDCEQVRYEHRFAPFGNVMTPPPVQYQQYRDMTDLGCYEVKPMSTDMYMASCKYFHQAKLLFESIQNPSREINSLIKVSKTNFIVMKLLAGGHKKESKEPPEFDFTEHNTFPIIKII